ncbi:MAG: hypothetical protein KatS3mg077_2443 [Candidatus Binatia bacterium]|nr:MAG: hypothetical protein KatS3mg077_2443 [Candidatus Binatia bacterium]
MSSRRRAPKVRQLAPRRHTVYRLGERLLLVFKPAGHVEEEHAHPQAQSWRVLAGTLAVQMGEQQVVLSAPSDRFTLPAGQSHKTTALSDTWLAVEQQAEH